MKADIETLKDTFKIGYDTFFGSRVEAEEIWNMFHNRQYTIEQENILEARGQPKETFNVIKLFSRMMVGYYSTVINTVTVFPTQREDIEIASLLNDVVDNIFEDNDLESLGDKLKLSAIINGIIVSFIDVIETGEKDQFGRPIRKVTIDYIPSSEIVLDPMSVKDDYSDGRYIHRFKWLPEDVVRTLYGEEILAKLTAYDNFLQVEEAEFDFQHSSGRHFLNGNDFRTSSSGQFSGHFRIFNNYLICHTIITDEDEKTWSIHWSGDIEISRQEVSHKDVKNPYRVQRIHTSDRSEYYGVFREVKESQKAINQAVIKLQLLVNTEKVFVETTAVEDISKFSNMVNRINGVIEVTSLAGIKVESMSKDILDQYTIIDKGLDRIQRVLGINDSFLGLAFASDSGRKVKLQQNATILALRYLTKRIQQYYKLLGQDVINLVRQYYTAHQVLRIADELTGFRWAEINKPMTVLTGEIDPLTGQPEVQFLFEEVKDPATNENLIDDEGNLIIAPIPEKDTEVAFTKVDVKVIPTAFNDEDEKNQLMIETVLSGNIGQSLLAVNPAGFFKIAGLSLQTMKTRYSKEIGTILENTASLIEGGSVQERIVAGRPTDNTGQPLSQELKLPQNTNEGAF